MAKKEETIFKERVFSDLRALGDIVWFTKIQQVAVRGIPDILMCVNGRFMALELKRPTKAKVTELQKYNIAKINKAKGVAYEVSPKNWDMVLKQIIYIAAQP